MRRLGEAQAGVEHKAAGGQRAHRVEVGFDELGHVAEQAREAQNEVAQREAVQPWVAGQALQPGLDDGRGADQVLDLRVGVGVGGEVEGDRVGQRGAPPAATVQLR
jgi:hypothetical protein